jgi:uncharacterized protein YcgL (UPF0745 family)
MSFARATLLIIALPDERDFHAPDIAQVEAALRRQGARVS